MFTAVQQDWKLSLKGQITKQSRDLVRRLGLSGPTNCKNLAFNLRT